LKESLVIATAIAILVAVATSPSAAECSYEATPYVEGSSVCQADAYMQCRGTTWLRKGVCGIVLPPERLEALRTELVPVFARYGIGADKIEGLEISVPVRSGASPANPGVGQDTLDAAEARLCFRCKGFLKKCKWNPSCD
jgi:hypothetical protein